MTDWTGGPDPEHDKELAGEPASASCEHFWASHVRGGSPISVRICSICGTIDFDDIDSQLATIISAERVRIGTMIIRSAT